MNVNIATVRRSFERDALLDDPLALAQAAATVQHLGQVGIAGPGDLVAGRNTP